MRASETNPADPQALALSALAWVLGEETRAQRLLSLTGLDAQALRERIGDPAMLEAVIGFLEAHEPDLVACAQTLGIDPAILVSARGRLAR